MVNNFQIEIIRQFEIQRTVTENLIQDFLIDEDDRNERLEAIAQSNETMAFEHDLAEGDDFVFFNKYGAAQVRLDGDDDDIDDDEFDSGYYF